MSLDHAFIAATRFGFGPRPGDPQPIAGDPRGWLRAQLGEAVPPRALQGLENTAALYTTLDRERQKGPGPYMAYLKDQASAVVKHEAARRTAAAIESDSPFRERLVQFWSNHFTVSATRTVAAALAGAFEREAVRPNVTGRFADLLLASSQHPGMLVYLDNYVSFGPQSRIGSNRERGLNENLAREILELHTLGVDGGYSQADVIALARIISGWSVAGIKELGTGRYRYRPFAHEPGDKVLLGKTYREDGEDEGKAALSDLARHPATARFIATKMARHFIADDPAPATVARLAGVFRQSDGDLNQMALALIDSPEVWEAPLSKFKTPNDLVISTFRSFSQRQMDDDRPLIGALSELGQFPFNAPSPAGWPDRAADWLAPEALMRRIEWARGIGQAAPQNGQILQWAELVLGPALSRPTRTLISQADSTREAVALGLASPEFQRR